MDDIKIVATFNICNEAAFIHEAIRSVLWCDKVIVVDGAYQGYPMKNPLSPRSDDGTAEIVVEMKKHNSKIIYIQMSTFTYGYEKIDAYLNLINDGDYFIRMNGDEVFSGNSKRIKSIINKTNRLPLYQIQVVPIEDPEGSYFCPKILRKSPGLKLTSKHVVLTNSFNPEYKLGLYPRGRVTPEQANIESIFLLHYSSKQPGEKKKAKEQWLKYYAEHQLKDNII